MLLRSQCEAFHAKNPKIGKMMGRLEGIVYQAMEEAQKQRELAKAEIQMILKEKDQLIADLSSMEKSFSDLFKRFEKQKEVIEGYRTVGGGEQACACPPPEGPWGAVVSPRPGLSCVLTLSRKLQSLHKDNSAGRQIGRASCRERV